MVGTWDTEQRVVTRLRTELPQPNLEGQQRWLVAKRWSSFSVCSSGSLQVPSPKHTWVEVSRCELPPG